MTLRVLLGQVGPAKRRREKRFVPFTRSFVRLSMSGPATLGLKTVPKALKAKEASTAGRQPTGKGLSRFLQTLVNWTITLTLVNWTGYSDISESRVYSDVA